MEIREYSISYELIILEKDIPQLNRVWKKTIKKAKEFQNKICRGSSVAERSPEEAGVGGSIHPRGT